MVCGILSKPTHSRFCFFLRRPFGSLFVSKEKKGVRRRKIGLRFYVSVATVLYILELCFPSFCDCCVVVLTILRVLGFLWQVVSDFEAVVRSASHPCLGPAAVSVCLPSPPPQSALCKFSMCILNCPFLSLICMSCFSSSSSALLRCPKLQTVVVQFIFSGQGRPHIYLFLFFCQSFVCHASLGQGGGLVPWLVHTKTCLCWPAVLFVKFVLLLVQHFYP